MHGFKKSPHDKLHRRILIGAIVFGLIAAAIAIPLIVNNELRYDLAMRTGQIPGQDVEKLAEGDEGAMLIVIPLDHDLPGVPTPWLFKAQFIAWPVQNGLDLENLETGERLNVPLAEIDFISANGDGSLILMRGDRFDTGEESAITIEPVTMKMEVLSDAQAVPDTPGNWETSIWTKQGQRCHRPSPNQRFIICFVNSDLNRYLAGDWELNVHLWGDFKKLEPLFRGMGYLPITGFVHNDTVVYFQNEHGIWRAEVPESLLEIAPQSTPLASPQP